jgi:hypothetical protein
VSPNRVQAEFERADTRLNRAFTAMEKCRQGLARLHGRLDRLAPNLETIP